jgi:N-acetylneuraminic acid mutarotase
MAIKFSINRCIIYAFALATTSLAACVDSNTRVSRPGESPEETDAYLAEEIISPEQEQIVRVKGNIVRFPAGFSEAAVMVKVQRHESTTENADAQILLGYGENVATVEILAVESRQTLPSDAILEPFSVEQSLESSGQGEFYALSIATEDNGTRAREVNLAELTSAVESQTNLALVSKARAIAKFRKSHVAFTLQEFADFPAEFYDEQNPGPLARQKRNVGEQAKPNTTEDSSDESLASAPAISLVAPNQGSTGGGSRITIYGSRFEAASTVSIGGVACLNFTFVDASTIQCTTPASAPVENSVIVSNADGTSSGSSHKFLFVTADSWKAMPLTNAPAPREAHTAIWTGTEMIVWGGTDIDSNPLSSGGRYDAQNNAWRALSEVNAPAPRRYHTAVWTGSEMIVWGGTASSLSDPLQTGARYDPKTDNWQPISTDGAPVSRLLHTAIWTGSKMIVWGGTDGVGSSTMYNSGAIYDPQNDAWVPTETGAPLGRIHHTAVWTGSKMIVWAGMIGSSTDSATDTGGVYDPVLGSWSSTTVVGAPAARFGAAAIWDGTSMIVYGGGNAQAGGKYNPTANGWTTMSASGAPAKHQFSKAVWTGDRMIVWGGGSPTNIYSDTGGRYLPSENAWTVTSNASVPSARVWHSVVWTGSQMLIFGGNGPSLNGVGPAMAMAEGAIYTP